MLTGASIVFFTYIGFDSVSTAAEECENPQRDLPVGIIATLIVAEGSLSFLGIGLKQPNPTWGNMISDSLPYYNVAWWFVAAPGVGLLLMTLAFNLLGDAVRDALDPNAVRR